MLLDQEEFSGFQVYVHLGFLRILGWCAQKCAPALPFIPTPQSGFCAEACWLNRGHSTHRRLPRVHEHTLPGKTTLGKNGLSLPKQGAQTHSLLLKTQAPLFILTLFYYTSFTVSVAVAMFYSSYFFFVYVLWSYSQVTFSSFHNFSLQ